jgi:NhaA family Na+:H+ antiporter
VTDDAWSAMPDHHHHTGVLRRSFLHGDSALARVARPLARFSKVEASSGIVLIVATVAALVWANSPWSASYVQLWSTPVEVVIGSYRFEEDLLHVVNDGLMALFFFVVGMEIKHELVNGELRDRRNVALPAMAALGGMVVPAIIFVLCNIGGDNLRGWGIPMATDIAFTLGVVALLGRRVPSPLKVFLLTLAIVDDIGAIVVIAIFYGDGVEPGGLVAAVLVACAVAAMRSLRVTYAPLYVIAGLALWLAIFQSGIHATIAGVVMGLLTPARPLQSEFDAEAIVDVLENRAELSADDVRATAGAIRESVSTCERLIDALHPWTSYVVVPLFALANAGVRFADDPFAGAPRVFIGVVLGLVAGKCLGITGFAWLATRLGIARLPSGVRWAQLVGAATLGGIGFTVSLFITGLAFEDEAPANAAKVGVLIASALAAALGAAVFATAARRRS